MVKSKKIEVNMITMLILIIFSLYKNKNKINEKKIDNNSGNWLEEKWSNVKLGN